MVASPRNGTVDGWTVELLGADSQCYDDRVVSGASGIGIRISPDLSELVSIFCFFKGRIANIFLYRRHPLHGEVFSLKFYVIC